MLFIHLESDVLLERGMPVRKAQEGHPLILEIEIVCYNY